MAILRKRCVVLSCLAVILCALTWSFLAFADAGDDDNAKLKEEISILKERLNALEARLGQSEAKVAKVEKEKTAATPEAGIPAAITSFAKEIEVHGSVDTGYIFNTNTPVSPNA